MYARNIRIKLNADSVPEFTRLLEEEIIPLLRKQKGFQDEISFLAPERNEAVAISFWDKQDNAEAYNHAAYLDVSETPVESSCRDAHHGYIRSRHIDLPANHGERRLTLKKVTFITLRRANDRGEVLWQLKHSRNGKRKRPGGRKSKRRLPA